MKRYKPENIREASALKYEDDKDRAPRITALGRGYVAKKMVEEARNSNVSVVQDEKLSHVLHRLNVGDEIPEMLYQVVAQILVYVYTMDEKSDKSNRMHNLKQGTDRKG